MRATNASTVNGVTVIWRRAVAAGFVLSMLAAGLNSAWPRVAGSPAAIEAPAPVAYQIQVEQDRAVSRPDPIFYGDYFTDLTSPGEEAANAGGMSRSGQYPFGAHGFDSLRPTAPPSIPGTSSHDPYGTYGFDSPATEPQTHDYIGR